VFRLPSAEDAVLNQCQKCFSKPDRVGVCRVPEFLEPFIRGTCLPKCLVAFTAEGAPNSVSFQGKPKGFIPVLLFCRVEDEWLAAVATNPLQIEIVCDRHGGLALPGKVGWNCGIGDAFRAFGACANIAERPFADNCLVLRDNFLICGCIPVKMHSGIARVGIQARDPRSTTIPRVFNKFRILVWFGFHLSSLANGVAAELRAEGPSVLVPPWAGFGRRRRPYTRPAQTRRSRCLLERLVGQNYDPRSPFGTPRYLGVLLRYSR
jgi:hypothetical protein